MPTGLRNWNSTRFSGGPYAAPARSCRRRGVRGSFVPLRLTRKTMQGKRNASGSAIASGSASRSSSPRAIRVRAARGTDRAFVLDTAARLADFGPPAWRTSEELVEGEARTLRDFFE